MSNEVLDIVDENNKVIGKEKRDIVHSKGLFHRAVNIFLFNSKGFLFLQKRSASKDVCPLTWDISASETLKSGEDYHKAAIRGLQEELSINAKLIKIRGVHLQKNEYFNGKIKDYEFVETYQALHNGYIKINKSEIAEGGFFNIKDIKDMIKKNRNQFTPWFIDEWSFMEENDLV